MGTTPPIHIPLRFEAAILSRILSPVTSRSNWAKESRTFRVSRPIDEVVLNCWVTDTKLTPCASNFSMILIVDRGNGKMYVGSAYGDAGIWSRWTSYIKTGHGGNDQLTRLIQQK